MKKLLFVTVLILLSAKILPSAASSHPDDADVIEIYRVTDIITRSVSETPDALISGDLLILSIYDGNAVYSLVVEDALGVIVYTSILSADGMEYSYDLSGIGEGLHRLVIKGPGGEFEGYFTLY